MSELLAMGGYAAYVWPAFAIATALLVGLFVHSRQAAVRREDELAQLRLQVRPQRARAAKPMRPRREVEPTGSGIAEGG